MEFEIIDFENESIVQEDNVLIAKNGSRKTSKITPQMIIFSIIMMKLIQM